jgi:hypothetical protein
MVTLTPYLASPPIRLIGRNRRMPRRRPAGRTNCHRRELKVYRMTAKVFFMPRQHVARCCKGKVRNITKQKSLVDSPELVAKDPHGHGIAEHSCR